MAKNSKGLDKKQPETIDGATGKADRHPSNFGTHGGNGRRIDLANLRDVRLELAYVYRQIDAGVLRAEEGTRRAYVLKTIGDIIATAELEARLQELEERYTRERPLQSQRSLPAASY